MGNRRVLILVIAVALAGLTALLTFNYANTADERANKGAQLVQAYVVKKDIPKGTAGSKALDDEYIGQEKIPRKFLPANAITDPQKLRTQVAVSNLSAGLPLVTGNFASPQVAQESFSGMLQAGEQAVTLAVSDIEGVARLIAPDDRVNLMLTTDKPAAPGQPGGGKETQYVLQRVKVLAVGNATMLQPGQAPADVAPQQAGVAKTVDSSLMTFAVPALDAEKLVHASQIGAIHLTLVPKDFTPAPVPPVNNGNLFS
ncbi:MAG TPA: Flp pilus assembly protein CpaB [Acidimicrobiia bacterium]